MKKNIKWIIIGVVAILILTVGSFFLYKNMKYISKNKVKDIILENTKLKEKDIYFDEIELEEDKETPVYEVTFFYNNIGFDYTINATNGKIIYNNFEGYGDYSNPIKPVIISEDEAKQIAIEAAGQMESHDLTDVDVQFTKVELDESDGYFYKINLRSNIGKYEFKIDAASRHIVDSKGEEIKK